jgi:signal transduction histidine kinase/ligand-binding sensor domain-containing protein
VSRRSDKFASPFVRHHSLFIVAFILARGIGASAAPSDYIVDVWRSDEGLPRNGIISIAQGGDGYLWIASTYALARFDGVRFFNFNPEIGATFSGERFPELKSDPYGTVWMSTPAGGLVQWRDGRVWRCLPEGTGWQPLSALPTDAHGGGAAMTPSGRILRWTNAQSELVVNAGRWGRPLPNSICGDHQQGFWFITDQSKLVRVEGTNAQKVSRVDGVLGTKWKAIAIDATGAIWAGTERELAVRRGEVFHRVETPETPFAVEDIIAVTEPRQEPGNAFSSGKIAANREVLWVVANRHLWLRQAEHWTKISYDLERGTTIGPRIADRRGNFWFSTSSSTALMRADPDGGVMSITEKDGLPAGRFAALCEDREGNIWAGIKRIGLARLRERRFVVRGAHDGVSAPVVWAVVEDSTGALWLATESNGVNRWQGDRFSQFNLGKAGAPGDVRSLCLDRRGVLWAGTADNGVFRFDNGTFVQVLSPAQIHENNKVFVIFENRAGQMWFGTDDGLFQIEAGQPHWIGDKSGIQMVRGLTEDANGRLWIAMWSGGVASLNGKKLAVYGRGDGLPHERVLGVQSDSNSVWMATMGGLCRWREGRFTSYTTAEGLPDNRISSVAVNGRGNLWLGSASGIFCISKASLLAFDERRITRLECLTFDRADGLPTRECTGGSQPSIWPTRDGRLWFATFEGAAAVSPDEVQVNTLPPPVLIEQALLDGRDIGAAIRNPQSVVKIPPGRHVIEFRYTATSLTAPAKVRFKYRLDGLDAGWREAGAARSAVYNVTTPGENRFRVAACNNDGVWNETGAAVAMTALPYFWQTWWFRIGAFAALFAVGGGAIRFFERRRMQRQLERLEMQQAVEKERARIARDIHDDVGASLTEIALLSEFAQNESAPPDQVKADVQKIASKARGSTQALDEIVWAVNPRNDTLDGFANYACAYAEEQLRLAGIRCRLDVPSVFSACPLSANVRHNLFLAFKEALNNVIKHSAASEAQIHIGTEHDVLVVLVTDNGRGFALNGNGNGNGTANGLVNLKDRLAQVGGEFTCETAPGKGTHVKLVVPLKKSLSAV